jgi:predicted peptidase
VFAAAVPICGVGEPATAARIKDIPVWAFHGSQDSVIPVFYTQRMVKAIEHAGGHPVYWEYTGASHAQTAERAYCEPTLLDWLFGQSKS